MKIITWNCNMAFRKKASVILAHKPDLLIVVECEHPDKLLIKEGTLQPKDHLWFGKNHHKGLAIFSFGDYRFKVLEGHNDQLKMIIPIEITGGHFCFNLFLIWAYNPDDMEGSISLRCGKRSITTTSYWPADRPCSLVILTAMQYGTIKNIG